MQPLHWAAAAGREPTLRLLLNSGAALDAVDDAGRIRVSPTVLV